MLDKILLIKEVIIKIVTFVGILPLWLAMIFLMAGVVIATYIIVDRRGENRMENIINYENTMAKLDEAKKELADIESQEQAIIRRQKELDKREADLEIDRENVKWESDYNRQVYEEFSDLFKRAGTYPAMEKLVEDGLRGQISVKEPFAMELKPFIKSVGLTTYERDQTVKRILRKHMQGPYSAFVVDCFDILTGKGMPPVIVAYTLYYYLSTKQPA